MAIAPERMGIGIRRHFTTPGVHPYDDGDLGAAGRPDHQLRDRGGGLRATRRRGALDVERQRHQHPGPEVLPGHPRARPSGSGRSSRWPTGWPTPSPVGAQGRLLRRRGRGGGLPRRAQVPDRPPAGGVQLAGVVQHRRRTACPSRRRPASSWPSTTRWTPSSTGTSRRGSSSRAGRAPGSTCPASARRARASRAAGRRRARSASCGAPTPRPARSSRGGKTRRAAKMVILNADHPDIEDFIWCKAIEERKARALRDAGFDMDLDGKDSHSIQYQNANNSVRVTDEFMQAVLDDADWHLRAVTTGQVLQTVKARDLFRQIAKAAWECADPGMQFDTTINRWHTAPNTGPDQRSATRAASSARPRCVTVDGPMPIGRDRGPSATTGEPACRRCATYRPSIDEHRRRHAWSSRRGWPATPRTLVDRARSRAGGPLRCTPEHRFLTAAGDVGARHGTSQPWTASCGPLDGNRRVSLSVEVVELARGGRRIRPRGRRPRTTSPSRPTTAPAVVVHNSEYMHLDNSACNLASLNLLRFLERGRHLRRRRLQGRHRGGLHRPGDPGRQRRLPDAEDRRHLAALPPARASATPTWAPCSWPRACRTTPTRAGPGRPPSPPC